MRDLVKTREINGEQLNGVKARLEKDSQDTTEIEHTGTEADKILRYKFDREVAGENWYGHVDVEVYGEIFQARGDEVIISRYFADKNIQELDV